MMYVELDLTLVDDAALAAWFWNINGQLSWYKDFTTGGTIKCWRVKTNTD